jgi:branched-chain amino acid transport system substrate-binding protein
MNSILRRLGATLALFTIAFCNQPLSAQEVPLRIGVITFLSGPAAGPFGVPAKNAADLLVEVLNKGGMIPGYEKKRLRRPPD